MTHDYIYLENYTTAVRLPSFFTLWYIMRDQQRPSANEWCVLVSMIGSLSDTHTQNEYDIYIYILVIPMFQLQMRFEKES